MVYNSVNNQKNVFRISISLCFLFFKTNSETRICNIKLIDFTCYILNIDFIRMQTPKTFFMLY